MPHQCVRCNQFYEDGSTEIINGCGCGGKLFFYVKRSKLEKMKNAAPEIKLSESEKLQLEEDSYELAGEERDESEPVILDFEAVKMEKPGKYEIDLVRLFSEEPLVYNLGDGKYKIDVAQSFKNASNKKKRKKAKK